MGVLKLAQLCFTQWLWTGNYLSCNYKRENICFYLQLSYTYICKANCNEVPPRLLADSHAFALHAFHSICSLLHYANIPSQATGSGTSSTCFMKTALRSYSQWRVRSRDTSSPVRSCPDSRYGSSRLWRPSLLLHRVGDARHRLPAHRRTRTAHLATLMLIASMLPGIRSNSKRAVTWPCSCSWITVQGASEAFYERWCFIRFTVSTGTLECWFSHTPSHTPF